MARSLKEIRKSIEKSGPADAKTGAAKTSRGTARTNKAEQARLLAREKRNLQIEEAKALVKERNRTVFEKAFRVESDRLNKAAKTKDSLTSIVGPKGQAIARKASSAAAKKVGFTELQAISAEQKLRKLQGRKK